MVFRGRDSSRARGRSRPFRFRGRGARRPYGRGSSRGGHDGKREEGLRITLRNVDAASYNRRDKSWSDDRESDRFEKYGEDYDDYDNYDKEKRDRRTPSRESRNSPPRKRQHIESDLLEDESLRITVGNDLYKKEGRSPSTEKQGDRPQYAEGEVWEGRGILRRVQEEEVDLTLKEVLNVVEGVEEVVMAVDSEIEEIIPLLKDPKLDLKDIVELQQGEEKLQSWETSYSHGRRSSSRDWRSSSRGRSHGRTRSHSRERSYSAGSRSPRRSSVGRSRSLPRSYSPGRRTSRSHSRGRSVSLRRSHSRSRGYSRSPRSYSRSSSQSGGRGHSRSRSGSIVRRYHRSPIRRGSRDSATGRRDSVDRRSIGRSRSSSSSSSSGSSKGRDITGGMSEKEYEEEMFRRLKSELTSNYSNPSEREERIAKHIREMAKISPVLFRNFMSKNAGNLAALTLPQEQEEEKPVDADTGANESPVSDPSQAKPLRSILKRKEGSLSPSRTMETEHLGEQPMSNIEKVIHSLRKGSGALEKEAASSGPHQTVALKHLSSYMDIEDEEEFLYGEEKLKKENPGPAMPFWSAHRFEEDASKTDLDLLEEHPRAESEQEASKTSSKAYESITSKKQKM
ncbi:micronuclear linker histone polyprotein-like [Pomacea canaliculata]|uniref:micronuclear linker histone polyprotein-like n=1 Tax=Pomacea canaliculata TaxID=400727 RepID=UPI000D727EA1|nr:micronuclear linker histone polyprotein-like [Pomacea canaliculata]